MSIRLIVSMRAVPGKGAELAQAYRERCAGISQEPGCEQFEVFQSVVDPDRLVLMELWKDEASLAVHAQVNASRPPLPAGLRLEGSVREDYTLNRTR